MTRKPTVGQRLRYAFDRTMSRGTPALVGWLAVVTAVLIAVFTLLTLVGALAPEGEDGERPGVVRQLFDTLLHALDPGTVAGDDGSWKFLVAMLVLTLCGLMIVSALIGVIATGLDAKLQELRKGRSHVLESGHTVILGWSETVFTILSELAIANASERDPVVAILARRDKVEMEDAIRERVPDLDGTRVVCRTGDPIALGDLEIVNPVDARSVIVLAPDADEEPDSQVIKVLLALTKGPHRRDGGHNIVAEIHDPGNMEAAQLVAGDEAVLVDKSETVSRLLVQASRQAGISVVYTDLLDFSGDEIYLREDPALAGRTYGEALLAYERCSLIGLRSDGALKLNPPADTPIRPGDELVAIAEDDAHLDAAVAGAAEVEEDAIVAAPPAPALPQRVLVLGWNGRGAPVVNELDEYAVAGSQLVIAADADGVEADVAARCDGVRNLSIEVRRTSTTERRALAALDLASFDSVIVLCYSDRLGPDQADARTLVTLLHLRDITDRTGARFTIVSEMLDDRNRVLAEVTRVNDVIVSDKVISLMLAQLSENERLRSVFAELFSAEGSEIYLRPAGLYVDRETSFGTVVGAARRRGETAIGYRLAALAGDASASYGVRLNPPKGERVDLGADDLVVVLAES